MLFNARDNVVVLFGGDIRREWWLRDGYGLVVFVHDVDSEFLSYVIRCVN